MGKYISILVPIDTNWPDPDELDRHRLDVKCIVCYDDGTWEERITGEVYVANAHRVTDEEVVGRAVGRMFEHATKSIQYVAMKDWRCPTANIDWHYK